MGLPRLFSLVPCTRIQGFEPTVSAWSGTAFAACLTVFLRLARLAPLLGFSLSRVFPSLTLRQISLVAPFTLLAVPLRPWLESQGIHRWANRLFFSTFSSRFAFSRFLIRFARRSPLLAKQPLPPELCALVQLPVPQWLSRLFTGLSTVMDHVAAVFAVTVRSALPPRCPPPLPLLRRPCDLRPLIPLLFSSILRISCSRLSV